MKKVFGLKRIAAPLLILLAGLSGISAGAESDPAPIKRHMLTILGGVTNPFSTIGRDDSYSSDDEKIGKSGPGYGLQYLYKPDHWGKWSIGGEVLYHDFGKTHVNSLILPYYAPQGQEVSYDQLDFHLLVRRVLGSGVRTTPFFLLAAGVSQGHLRIESAIGDPYYAPPQPTTVMDDKSLTASGALGFGIDHHLSEHVVLGAEARLTFTAPTGYEATSAGAFWIGGELSGRTTDGSLLARVGYTF